MRTRRAANRSQKLWLDNWTWRPLGYLVLDNFCDNSLKQEVMYEVWWVFYPGISFWLICTTRRWDRGSVWGHTLFLSELNFLVSMRKPIFLVARDQASIPARRVFTAYSVSRELRRSHDWFFETKNRAIFLERFFGRGISGAALLPYNFVPINWLWSGFIFPELEHL